MKAIISVAVALVLLAGLVLLLSAAEVIPNPLDEDHGKTYSIAFVLGAHANSRTINFDSNTVLQEKLEKVAKTYGFFSLVVADGDPTRQSLACETIKPDALMKLLNFFNGKEKIRDRANAIKGVLRSQRANTAEVDTLKALNIAARQLSDRPPSDEKEIVVLGTGLSTTGFLNLREDDAHWLYSDAEEIVTILTEGNNLPSLKGITVTWCQMHDVGEPQQEFDGLRQENLVEIWRRIVENGGGKFVLKEVPPGTETYISSESDSYPPVSVIELRPPEPIATSVSINPKAVTLSAGDSYSFAAVVEGANSPPQEVTWSVSGNSDPGTKIEDGALTVAQGESSKELVVRAVSNFNDTISAEVSVTIAASHEEAGSIDVNPDPSKLVLEKGKKYPFEATITKDGNTTHDVKWEISGNKGNTKITQKGVLTVGANETASEITIKVGNEPFTITIEYNLPVLPEEVEVKFKGDEPQGKIPGNNGKEYFLEGREKAIKDIQKWVDYINDQAKGVYLFGCTAKTDGDDSPRLDQHVSLGQKRADAVKELFVNHYKIDESKIIAVGLGYNNPWHKDNGVNGDSSWNDAAARENRRVLIMSADDEYAQKVHKGKWR